MIAPNSRRLTSLLLVCFVFAVHTLRDTVHCYRFQLVFFVGNTGNLSKMAELIEMPFEWQTFVSQGILWCGIQISSAIFAQITHMQSPQHPVVKSADYCVGHMGDLCKSGWTASDWVCGADSCGCQQLCKLKSRSPWKWHFWGGHADRPMTKCALEQYHYC